MHFGFAETNSVSERIESFIFRLSSVTNEGHTDSTAMGLRKGKQKRKKIYLKLLTR